MLKPFVTYRAKKINEDVKKNLKSQRPVSLRKEILRRSPLNM